MKANRLTRSISLILTFALLLGLYAPARADVTASGTCGDNLTWTLDDAGTLTISGTGDMKNDWDYPDDPCYSLRDSIQSVVIASGITSIGSFAFHDCGNLTSVSIPDSVTSIGDGAFSNFESLTSVSIGNGVTSIGNDAFHGCSSLTSITIPDSVTSIGNEAFSECSSLTRVSIGNGVTSIGYGAFRECRSLESVSIPNSITSIGEGTFSGCTSLTNITIPDSVTSIGKYAFDGCSSLTNLVIGNGMTSIGDWAFWGCDNLTNLVISSSVTSIGDGAFSYFESLTSVSIGNGVTSIGNDAFHGCSSLTSITIPDSVTSIGNEAFCECSNLTRVSIGNGVTSIGYGAFRECRSLASVSIPDSVTSIGEGAFSECSSLTNITIPDSVTSIGNYAFVGCSSLTNITIPDSVTSIGECAFDGCSSLTSVTIGNGVRSIGDWAFEGCSSLTNITIPDSVTSIGDGAFLNCPSLLNVTVINTSSSNSAFRDIDGVLFSKDGHRLIVYPGGKRNVAYSIPNAVTEISAYAFCYCSSLTSITIPDSVTSVGSYVFADCDGLAQIVEMKGVPYIPEGAYSNCTGLTRPEYPDNVTRIDSYAFSGCKNLTKINLPDTLKTIGNSAFRDCTGLTSITIPDSVTSIGSNAFSNCNQNLVLCVFPGSYAETYAIDNNISYQYVGTESFSLSLTVTDADGLPLSGGYTVYWYESGNVAPIAVGNTVSNIDRSKAYAYEIILDGALGTQFLQPDRVAIEDNEQAEYTCALSPIPTATIAGQVLDADGQPVAGAALRFRQTVNARFPVETTAKSDTDGRFRVELPDTDAQLTVTCDGYYTAVQAVSPADGTAVTLSLEPLPQSKLTLALTALSPADGDGEAAARRLPSFDGLRFTLYNQTQGKEVTDFVPQYPDLILGRSGVAGGDTLLLRAEDVSGTLGTAEVTATVDAYGVGSASLRFVENGCVRVAAAENVPAVLLLFTQAGELAARAASENGEIQSAALPEGTYRAVVLQKTDLLPAVRSFDRLDQLGLTAGADYLLFSASVTRGKNCDLGTVTVPALDSGKLLYTDSDRTSLSAGAREITTGRYVSLRAEYAIREKYRGTEQTVSLVLPAGMELVKGSVTLDGKSCAYFFSDGVLTVRTGKSAATLRCYCAVSESGSLRAEAWLSFRSGGDALSQLIGSVEVTASAASISLPSRTASREVSVSGQALPNSTVILLDNGTAVCETTANKVGSWSAMLPLRAPANNSLHDIQARITTPANVTYYTATRQLCYDETVAECVRVTMLNAVTPKTVFNFQTPDDSKHSYSYSASYPTFTFLVELSGDAESVQVITENQNGDKTAVDCNYYPSSGKWIGTHDYTSFASVPVNVSVSIVQRQNQGVTSFTGTASAEPGESERFTVSEADAPSTPDAETSFSLREISPTRAGAGQVTIRVTGTLLEPNAVPVLSGEGGSYPAETVYWQNHETMYAVFRLYDAPSGTYSLCVDCAERSAVLSDCFTLDDTLPQGRLSFDVRVSENAVPGETLTGCITATNVGSTDADAPTVVLRGENMLLGAEDGTASEEVMLLFLQNGAGLAGILAPGETAGANFVYQVSQNGAYHLNLLDCATLDEALPESEALADSLRSMMGGTYRRFAANAAKMANALDDGSGSPITAETIEAACLQNLLGVDDSLTVTESATDLYSTDLLLSREFSNPALSETEGGLFGAGWSTNYDIFAAWAAEDGAEVIALTAPNGVSLYTKNENGTFVNLLSEQDTAVRNAETGEITVTRRSGETLRFNADGLLIADTDVHGNRITLTYNNEKQLTRVQSSDGDALSLTYENGNVVSAVSEATGDSVNYHYSGGRLASVITKYGTTAYTYQTAPGAAMGALTGIVYPDGVSVSYGYDEYGRVNRVSDGELDVFYTYGLYEITARDSLGNATRTGYDTLGHAVWSIDSGNRVSYAEYDDGLRLTRLSQGHTYAATYAYSEDGLPIKATLPDGSVVNYGYDAMGNITAITDAKGQTTRYDRNSQGSVTALRYMDGSAESYTYDERGRVLTAVTRGGVTISFTYDGRGNVTREAYSSGETRDYTYDAYGNVTSITENGTQTTSLRYDERGDLLAVAYPDGKTISYAYDSLGRRVSVTDPDGYVTGYTYDGQGRLHSVTDGENELIVYSYNADGTLARQDNANGSSTEYQYEDGNLTLLTNYGADGVPLSFFRYRYDELGQIAAMEENAGTWVYGYDALGQLIYAKAPDGTETEYAYDAAGNRTSVTAGGVTTAYTADSMNRYTAYGDATRTYDADGNLLTETRDGKTARYVWNVYGQLTRYTDFDGKVWEYGYDAFGLRRSVTVDGVTTTYRNDPTGYGFAAASYCGEEATHYAVAGGVAAARSGGETYFYHANHLGSVTEITGADGAMVNQYRYNQEGDVIARTEGIANPYTYVGVYGIVNDGNGLIYDRARYVSAETKSFISEDPAGQTYDLNVYRYSFNSPTQIVDYTGKHSEGSTLCVIFTSTLDITGAVVVRYALQNKYPSAAAWGTIGIIIGGFANGVATYDLLHYEEFHHTVAGKNWARASVLTGWISLALSVSALFVAPEIVVGLAFGSVVFGAISAFAAWKKDEQLLEAKANLIASKTKSSDAVASLDPSGYVYAGVTANPIEGVTATVYYESEVLNEYGEGTGEYETRVWDDAADYSEINPQETDAFGQYGWDVPEGRWRVHFEKEGYDDYWTDWMAVPPEYTDVNINLQSLSAPAVSEVTAYPEEIRIAFDQYMDVASVSPDAVTVLCDGEAVTGRLNPVNAAYNFEQTARYASVFTFTPAETLGGNVTVAVANTRSYAGVAQTEAYSSSHVLERKPELLQASANVYADYLGETTITLQVLPAEAGRGKTLRVESLTPGIATATADSVAFGDDGTASVTVSGQLPGSGVLRFTLEGTDLTASTTVNVMPVRETLPSTFALTVDGGVGSGDYAEGAAVSLSAQAPAGQRFVRWDGSEGLRFSYGDAENATARFAMPAAPVTLTAVYEDLPAVSAELSGQTLRCTVKGPANMNALLIVASYDENGRMLGSDLIDAAPVGVTSVPVEPAWRYRVFLAESGSAIPLTEAWDSRSDM